jgi:soluble lytic murein transglycosylase-like protein
MALGAPLSAALGAYRRSVAGLPVRLAQLIGLAGALVGWWAARLALAAALVALLVALLMLSARTARAEGAAAPMPRGEATAATATGARRPGPGYTLACLDKAAAERGLDARLLRAVARAESNLNPLAVNRTHVERTGTVDIGLLQINSSWLPTLGRYGIQERHLYDACTNARVGAWLLADALARHGNTWNAVGSYNAACAELRGSRCAVARQAYAWRVFRRMDSGPGPSHATAASVAMQRPATSALVALTQLAAWSDTPTPTPEVLSGPATKSGTP